MTTLGERELLRARWRRTLALHALDQDDREDFAQGGLAGRLRHLTTQLLLLPADPEANPIDFDETFTEWFRTRAVIQLDHTGVRLPSNVRRTAHSLVLADTHDSAWSSYLAVHRSGAVEFGLGDIGGWQGRDHGGDPARVLALTPVVARVWAMLCLAAELASTHGVAGPYQLTVGVRSQDAQLGVLAEGWAEPGAFNNHVGTCADINLLWHLELDALPDSDGAREIAYGVGNRLEDAWGVAQRRYLASRGDLQGQLDPRRMN